MATGHVLSKREMPASDDHCRRPHGWTPPPRFACA